MLNHCLDDPSKYIREIIATVMSDDTFRPESGPGSGSGPRIGRRISAPFRNIPLTPELIARGITDIVVQAKNMWIRGPRRPSFNLLLSR